MKKGNKKSSIIDRAKSNMEENRRKQKLQKICKKLFKYFNTFNGRFVLIFLFTIIATIIPIIAIIHKTTVTESILSPFRFLNQLFYLLSLLFCKNFNICLPINPINILNTDIPANIIL